MQQKLDLAESEFDWFLRIKWIFDIPTKHHQKIKRSPNHHSEKTKREKHSAQCFSIVGNFEIANTTTTIW